MDIQKLIDLHSKGMSDTQIAREFGYKCGETIRQQRLKLNLPSNGRKSLEKFNREEANELREKGLSYKEIANKMGVKPITINCYFLKKNGKLTSEQRSSPSIPLTQEQKEVLFGTLLGDGNLRYTSEKSKNVSGKIEHGMKQFDYLKHKHNLLKNLSSDIRIYNRFDERFKNPHYQTCLFGLNSNPCLNEFYEIFYKNSESKKIPKDLSLLTPRALAILFQDDGSREGLFALCSYSKEDLNHLMDFLLKTYNFRTVLYKRNILRIIKEDLKHFEDLIKPYMCKSMYYKLKFL